MIKSWEVRSLRGHARARLGYHVNQTYPLNTAQMLTGHAVQRALNINDRVSRQLALILIFDLNRHETVPCSFFGLNCMRRVSIASNAIEKSILNMLDSA